MPKSPPLKTHSDVAQACGVSTKTIAAWRDNYADWPPRTAAGNFSRRAVDAFCRRHGLGPYRERSRNADELRRVTTQHMHEKAERLKVTNERLRQQFSLAIADIVSPEDARRLHEETRETVLRVFDQRRAEIESLLAECEEPWKPQILKVLATSRKSIEAALQPEVEA